MRQKEKKADLAEYGIGEGISEVIATTINRKPNAAPLGIHNKESRLFAKIFSSKTLDNIKESGFLAANIIDDPILFVKSAFGDLEESCFEMVFIDNKVYPVLKDANAWVLFHCKCRPGRNATHVDLIPVEARAVRKLVMPLNRGFNAVIEAAIHGTRYLALGNKKYLGCIDYYNKIASKCGGERERTAMKLLYDFLRKGC